MSYTDVLTRIGEATSEELAGARDEIVAALEEFRSALENRTVTAEQLEQIEALGDAHKKVTDRLGSLETEATERADRAGAVLQLLDGGKKDDDDDGGDRVINPEQPSADPETQPDHVAPGQPGAPPAPRAEDVAEPVAAAANPPLGAVTRNRPAVVTPRTELLPVLTAAADVTGFSAGQPLRRDQLGDAFSKRLQSLRGVHGGNGERVQVATFTTPNAPDARRLRSTDNGLRNTRLVEAQERAATLVAAGHSGLVAAGGLCAPFTPIYNIDVIGSRGRPVRDALAGYQADRGGVYLRPDLDASTVGPAASGVWTNENDAAVGSGDEPDPKPHAVVECPDMIQAQVEAETFQLEFSNVTARFDPESTAANIEAALIAHDRWAENRLLAKLAAGSKTVKYDQKLGAVRDILAMINQTVAYYRSLRRLTSEVPLTLIAPAWLEELFRVDILRAMHTSNADYFSFPQSKIDAWFRELNVNITWHLDGSTAAVTGTGGAPNIARQQYGLVAANASVPGFPDQVDLLLFQTGKWLHLDGGTLDLGIVRDSGLIENNRYRMFTEEWVGTIHKGVESLHMVATVQPNGASSGTVAPNFTD